MKFLRLLAFAPFALGALAAPTFAFADLQRPLEQSASRFQFVDWKSFFHGDPPPVTKAPPPKERAIVSSLPGATTDPQVESFMRALADAVMARDATPILPRLSARYAIDGMPDDAKAADFMAQAVARMPGPTRMLITSIERKADVRIAKVEFHYSPEKVTVKTFRFDTNGNLLSSDLFNLARA